METKITELPESISGTTTLSNQDAVVRAALVAVTTVAVTAVAEALLHKVKSVHAARKLSKVEVQTTK